MNAGVVFVNYHSEDLIEPQARELVAAGFTVVVADNSRTYPTAAAAGDGVALVDCGGNVGFGAACNQAVRSLAAAVDVVCLHNPDVLLPPAELRELVGRVSVDRPVLAPAILTDGRVRTTGYHYPSPARERFLQRRFVRGQRAVAAPGDGPPEVRSGSERPHRGRGRRFGTAALLAFRRDTFAAVGGFDERFFLYAEDLELWHRFVRAGFDPAFAPDLVANHIGHAGSPLAAASRELLREVGVEYFAELHDPRGWERYRRAHRAQIAALGAPQPVVDAVVAAWDAGLAPSDVLDVVRPLVDGRTPAPVR